MTSARRRVGPFLGLWVALAAAAAADGPRFSGRRLAEVLHQLSADGHRVVFSDRLVPPELRVAAEPATTEPLAVLAELLAPHGLEARRAGDGLWVVARRRATSDREGDGTPLAVAREEIFVLSEERRVPGGELGSLDLDVAGTASMLPGADPLRVLRELPGTGGEEGSALVISRGDPTARATVVVDGHEVVEPLHLRDFGAPRSVFAPATIAGARQVPGPSPDRAERGGGVVELVTVVPTARQGHVAWSPEAEEVGSAGTVTVLGRELGWLVNLREGEPVVVDELQDGARPPRFWDGLGKLTVDLGSRQELRLSALVARNDFFFGTFAIGEAEQLSTRDEIHEAWASHGLLLAADRHVETRVSWSRLDRDRLGVEIAAGEGFAIYDQRRLQTVGLRQDWQAWRRGRHELRAGAEATRAEVGYLYSDRFELYLLGTVPDPDAAAFSRRVRSQGVGAYASDRLRLGPRVTLDLGLRFDYAGWVGRGAASPQLAVASAAGRSGVVRLELARSHRFQRALDLRIEDGETAFLPPERADRVSVGYGRRFESVPGLGVRVEAWHRRVADPWPRFESRYRPRTPFPEVEGDRLRLVPEESVASGVEITLSGRAGGRVDWRATYGWAEAADRVEGRSVPLRYDATHSVGLALDWRAPGGVDLYARWHAHTGWPATAASTADGAPPSLFGERLPASHRLDVGVSREWRLRRWRLRLQGEVENLYDRENARGVELAPGAAEPSLSLGRGRRITGGVVLER